MNYVSLHGTSKVKISGLSSEGTAHHEYLHKTELYAVVVI
jgi:hypothetical protein